MVVGILEEMKRIGVKIYVVAYNATLGEFYKDDKDFDAASGTLNETVR